jgi:asparagine synthase (glutamine-hydrolysing)
LEIGITELKASTFHVARGKCAQEFWVRTELNDGITRRARRRERWLPPSVYQRKKVIFRAPLDSFHLDPEPAFVKDLLSDESLKRTGYCDVKEVQHWRKAFRNLKAGSLPRLSVEMGLVAVVATQLWHHLFIDGNLADLPSKKMTPNAIAA